VLLQVSFFPNIVPGHFFPDLALIIILFWTIENGFEETWKWAVLAGLLVDLANFWSVGTNVFSFVFTAYVINSFAKRFLVTQTVFRFLILAAFIILGTVINGILVILAAKIANKETLDFGPLFFNADIFFKIFCNLGTFLLIYAPLMKLKKISRTLDSRLKSFA